MVNAGSLSIFSAGDEVDPEVLQARGLLKNLHQPLKILGYGDIEVALTVKAHKFSGAARTKIEAAGGKAEEVAYATKAER